MFDEFIRELKRLEQPISVPIDMPLDDSAYAVGQRLVTGRNHVLQLCELLEKMVTGLKGLVP